MRAWKSMQKQLGLPFRNPDIYRSLQIIPTPLYPCICRELVPEHTAAATLEGYWSPRNSRCVDLDCWSLARGICHAKAMFTQLWFLQIKKSSDGPVLQTSYSFFLFGRLMWSTQSELVSKHLVTQTQGRNVSMCLSLGSWPPTVVLVLVFFQGLLLRLTGSIKDCFAVFTFLPCFYLPHMFVWLDVVENSYRITKKKVTPKYHQMALKILATL